MDLQEKLSLTYLFISHDLSVVRHISDRILVMYLGKAMELSPTEELFSRPLHPYTRALLQAVPNPDPRRRSQRQLLVGDVPSPINPPSGCVFHTRCPLAVERCATELPELRDSGAGHEVACHLC
jgi:oligopeptide/dipeptide ABC transporter ATP-binding protein